ncbi:Alpha-N-acetylgalactosaminidase [Sesbania bispinosa]|nr:Alpha-N-acetylgalactosaminidase [Sesbania bispinosa]
MGRRKTHMQTVMSFSGGVWWSCVGTSVDNDVARTQQVQWLSMQPSRAENGPQWRFLVAT